MENLRAKLINKGEDVLEALVTFLEVQEELSKLVNEEKDEVQTLLSSDSDIIALNENISTKFEEVKERYF